MQQTGQDNAAVQLTAQCSRHCDPGRSSLATIVKTMKANSRC